MPTYLVAFVISDFEMNSKTSANSILFRVFARSEQLTNTALALEAGEKALELFERAFETRYELEKLDQVALPVFNRGGMENYGVVFYREDYLLYEPSVSAKAAEEKAFSSPSAEPNIIRVYCLLFSLPWLEGYQRVWQGVGRVDDCS